MNRKRYVLLSLLLIVLLAISVTAYARSGYLSDFNNMYGTSGTRLDDCVLCHINTQTRNPYGADIESYILLGYEAMNAISIVEPYDSDGDGSVNIDEINALTFPGDASDYPSGPACTDADSDTFAIEGGSCGPVDCNDADPLVNPGAVEVCDDLIDNDCNSLVDCDDLDCADSPACAGTCVPTSDNEKGPKCSDGLDNDCDGVLDCADPDCSKAKACK